MRQNKDVVPDIDTVWARIEARAGEPFVTKTGKEFTYEVKAGCLIPKGRNRRAPRTDVAKALRLVPLIGPGEITQYLQCPAYIYAVLMDSRIRLDEW